MHTKADGKSGSLVMYRDSFGNALLPFIAEAFGDAYFSRLKAFLFIFLSNRKGFVIQQLIYLNVNLRIRITSEQGASSAEEEK